jgi:hypothetical protein
VEEEVTGGGVIEAESEVEVEVPEDAVSVVETGFKTLVVSDGGPGSTSETSPPTSLPTPDRMLERPPSTPSRRPPLLNGEGAGVMKESEAAEVKEPGDGKLWGVDDKSVGGEGGLLSSTPPLPRPKGPLSKSLTSCLFTASKDFLACECNGDE